MDLAAKLTCRRDEAALLQRSLSVLLTTISPDLLLIAATREPADSHGRPAQFGH
jgi:hypothetical protein